MNLINIQSPTKFYENQSQRYEYQQKDLLGDGSFGCVFKGFDREMKETVALKLINLSVSMTNFDKLLEQELEILQRIPKNSNDDFKHLITYKDFYVTSNHYVIVMELFENSQELLKYMEKKKKLSEDHALEIFNQVIKGINALHSLNIAHRDIKPQNILIRTQPELQIKIIDFGYSKRFKTDKEMTLTIAGSPIYMSPQNLFQIGYNPYANDIWSLGIMLYQMVTNRFPWRARTGKELDKELMKYIAQEINVQTNNLSMYIKEIVVDCLKINEDERISAKALKWKVDQIIKETIKQSYQLDVVMPQFDWVQVNNAKPKLQQEFANEQELLEVLGSQNQDNAQMNAVWETHLKLLKDLLEYDKIFSQEVIELEDYLGVFGYVLLKLTRNTIKNTINQQKLQKFWLNLHLHLKCQAESLSQVDKNNIVKKLDEIELLYEENQLKSIVEWESEKSFIQGIAEQLNQNTIQIEQSYQESYLYLINLIQKFY